MALMGGAHRTHLSFVAVLALVFAARLPAQAQGKDAFVQALIQFSRGAAGTDGDEAGALRASLGALASGLSSWNDSVARVEAGFKGAIGSATPGQAVQMRAALGATYIERGRYQDALVVLGGAPADQAVPSGYHRLASTAHERLGDTARARERYQLAFSADPTGHFAAYALLTATRGAAVPDRQRAISLLVNAAIAAGGGTGPGGLVVLGLELLDDASADVPLFPMSAYAAGVSLLAGGRFDEAVTELTAAAMRDTLLTDPAREHEGARTAAQALAQGNGPAAVAACARVPTAERSTEVQRLLGLAYWTSGQYDDAVAHLRASVRLDPDNERARLSLADVLVAAGRRDEARASLLDTTEALPRSGQAWWRVARLALDASDEPAALRAYEAAARLTPIVGASLVHGAIGRLRHNALDLDGAAIAHAARAAAAPTSVAAHLDLGRVFAAQDRLDEASVELAAAVLIEPSHADALVAFGQLRADVGDDAGALTVLRAARAARPTHAETRYALAQMLRRSGQAAEADAELEAFRQLQRESMAAERRRFEETGQAIEKALQGRTP
jgi:tetratricopeptide (TPR) repeat protein